MRPSFSIMILIGSIAVSPNSFLWGEEAPAPSVTVMTRNIYIGFDVEALLEPDGTPDLGAAFANLIATDFFERAEALADEVVRARPHLIGLQEVTVLRSQSPGDALGENPTPAGDVLVDYCEVLLAAIAARGLDYRPVVQIQNADVELPLILTPEPDTYDDIRLTDADVILARGDVEISAPVAGHYHARLPTIDVEAFGMEFSIDVPRGYVAVTATIGSRTYRFVNTHLEPAANEDVLLIQLGQAQELVAALEAETLPVILAGDINSIAPDGATYQYLLSAGYVDAWTLGRDEPGYTWGHSPDLRNEEPALSQRIDIIFVRGSVCPRVPAFIVGDDPNHRTVSGLWPSDHAGVVARLRIPQSEDEADGDGDGVRDQCDNCLETRNPNQEDQDSNGVGDACERFFIRGDANVDGAVDVADVVFVLLYLFRDGTEPPCMKAADVNDDSTVSHQCVEDAGDCPCGVNLSDAAYLFCYLFVDGEQPPTPFPSFGTDPTPDGLTCRWTPARR